MQTVINYCFIGGEDSVLKIKRIYRLRIFGEAVADSARFVKFGQKWPIYRPCNKLCEGFNKSVIFHVIAPAITAVLFIYPASELAFNGRSFASQEY